MPLSRGVQAETALSRKSVDTPPSWPGDFAVPIKLGVRAVGFRSDEVEEWIERIRREAGSVSLWARPVSPHVDPPFRRGHTSGVRVAMAVDARLCYEPAYWTARRHLHPNTRSGYPASGSGGREGCRAADKVRERPCVADPAQVPGAPKATSRFSTARLPYAEVAVPMRRRWT